MKKLLLAVVVAAAMALPLGATALAGPPGFAGGPPSLPEDVCTILLDHGAIADLADCPLPGA